MIRACNGTGKRLPGGGLQAPLPQEACRARGKGGELPWDGALLWGRRLFCGHGSGGDLCRGVVGWVVGSFATMAPPSAAIAKREKPGLPAEKKYPVTSSPIISVHASARRRSCGAGSAPDRG